MIEKEIRLGAHSIDIDLKKINIESAVIAKVGKLCLDQGALMTGGCSGTSPDHIRSLSLLAKG